MKIEWKMKKGRNRGARDVGTVWYWKIDKNSCLPIFRIRKKWRKFLVSLCRLFSFIFILFHFMLVDDDFWYRQGYILLFSISLTKMKYPVVYFYSQFRTKVTLCTVVMCWRENDGESYHYASRGKRVQCVEWVEQVSDV